MSRIMWSTNETPAFRHFFHYYYFMGEGWRVMHPELLGGMPTFFDAEVLAYEYKEYLSHGIPGLAGNYRETLPSGS